MAAGTRVTLSLRPRKEGVRAFCGTETATRPLSCRPLAWYGLGWQCDAPRAELMRLPRKYLKKMAPLNLILEMEIGAAGGNGAGGLARVLVDVDGLIAEGQQDRYKISR